MTAASLGLMLAGAFLMGFGLGGLCVSETFMRVIKK